MPIIISMAIVLNMLLCVFCYVKTTNWGAYIVVVISSYMLVA